MKLHEFQAKAVLKSFGVPVPEGVMAVTHEAAGDIAKKLGGDALVVKAQVHAGGRGKAGGIKVVKNSDEAVSAAKQIIGMKLVTKQTGAVGKIVSKVLVEKGVDVERELYLGMLVDRETAKVVVIASSEGGMEIEEVAHKNPEKIIKTHVDPLTGLKPFQCRNIAYALKIPQTSVGKFVSVLQCSYNALVKNDLSLLEINPLVVTKTGDVMALDAKISVDDNALFRQKLIAEYRDVNEEDAREVEAEKHGLNYISLDGSIGCLVNGAGLAMATMDIIKFYGNSPANFLDVGGSASVEAVTAGFKIILSDPNVKAVLVNIFGGIMRCDVVAQSIVTAAKEASIHVPLVVRLQGTNADIGRDILAKSDVKIVSAITMDEAAKKVVEAVWA